MTSNLTAPPSHRITESLLPVPTTAEPMDDSGSSGAEGPARKRFQRAPADHPPNVLRKQPQMTNAGPAKPSSMENKQHNNFAARRRSINHKGPLGPRPLQHSPSKRVANDANTASTYASRSFLPTSTSESPFGQPESANDSRYSFAKTSDVSKNSADSGHSYDFLPSVSFDDFHASLASCDPELSHFPAPGGGGFLSAFDANNKSDASREGSIVSETSNQALPVRSSSLARRHNGAKKSDNPFYMDRAAQLSNNPLPVRTRRQSQFPTTMSNNAAARPPRKSVGPGLLSLDRDARDGRRSGSSDGLHGNVTRSLSVGKGRRQTIGQRVASGGSELPRGSTTSRAAKARSFHPGTKPSNMTPETARTSAKSPHHSTPLSSASKRQSIVPHVSGLGARTISPTDARRMKRMSMMPAVPPVPRTPPTPQPDLPVASRSTANSPSLMVPKTMTPTSARATPEQNRKLLPALSSSSSITSLRTQSNRNSHLLSNSRLPTPKARPVHSSAGMADEDVPPVPAIPKAYESPNEVQGNPFAAMKLQNQTPDRSSQNSGKDPSSNELSAQEGSSSEASGLPQKSQENNRHRRGKTVGSDDAEKPPVDYNVNKRNLQPLRLPPLNLLPLSTPIGERIASFPAPTGRADQGTVTPPMKRNTKTPSTPMTASKATFFSKNLNNDSDFTSSRVRSSTAHYYMSNHKLDLDIPDLPSGLAMSIPASSESLRNIATPISTASLPKPGEEPSHQRNRPSGEYRLSDADREGFSVKPAGPRALGTTKKDSSSAHTSTSTEPETPSSGSSLRRKLSLRAWRHDSSKASHRAQASQPQINYPVKPNEDSTPRANELGDMPPPKLPASANWNESLTTDVSPSPNHKLKPAYDIGRQKGSGSALASDTDGSSTSTRKRAPSSTAKTPSSSDPQPRPQRSTSSFMSPMHRMLGSKSSSSALKARNADSGVDKADLAADEEMRRLGSKRKDFEAAAKELDELRKRAKPQERVSPAQALKMVSLNIFERGEIIDYKDVYFCGTKNAKKHVGDLKAGSTNFGYDDERGDYKIVLGDHLAYRYEVVDVLGKGSFGQVVRCVDHKTGLLVAVKIIRNKKRFHQQALVEVNILQKLREWDPDNKHSMINFTQSFYFRGHLCISTELLGMNLYEFIKAHEFKGFSLKLIRRFTKQMLSALCLLKNHRVIHCDLKPENILLAHPLQSEIKVIDFGSSCFENEKVYTYIQSRFYRSPEVILGMSYGLPIDMWSLGCILAELLTGYPIFPGENEQEQLACIMEIFGPPEKHLIEKSSRKKLFFDSLGKPRVTVSSKGRRRRPSSKTLQQVLKCDDDAFLDFVARCLRWDPDRRMKPDEALNHEFITGVKRPRQASGRMMSANIGNSSPMKRMNTVQATPQRTRPLPEPPATSFKNGTAIQGGREMPTNSPVKHAPRRHSTVNGLASSSAGVKRGSNGAIASGSGPGPVGSTSSLPRIAQRSVSGKPDLASAAAAASLVSVKKQNLLSSSNKN